MIAPVFFRDKGPNLALTFHDEAERHALDTSRRGAATYFHPEQRADLVSDQPIQNSARLLGIHQLGINDCQGCERPR